MILSPTPEEVRVEDEGEEGDGAEGGEVRLPWRRYRPTGPLPRPRPDHVPVDWHPTGEPVRREPYGTTVAIEIDGEIPCYWDW